MSYILDALRKSEQQRQAVQPVKITDRLLTVPSDANKNSNKWFKALLLFNLMLALSFAWFLLDKPKPEPNLTTAVNLNKDAMEPGKLAAIKHDVPPLSEEYQRQKQAHSTLPALSQHVDSNKAMDTERYRSAPAKKETLDKKIAATKKRPSHQDAKVRPIPDNNLSEIYPEQAIQEKHAPVDVKELPYQDRNKLPPMTINVFSYAHKPEDRFVIIDMVKYKPGQYIKGAVKLKEIREDSIVVQDGNNTFKVERP